MEREEEGAGNRTVRLFARSTRRKLARCGVLSHLLSLSLGDGSYQEQERECWKESVQENCLYWTS